MQTVRVFLAAHNSLTLATAGADGEPQAAALFYAADEDLNLYFLSSPNSRHSQNLLREPRVAATIHADGQAWQAIRGLQIEGTAEPVESVQGLAHAAWVYAGRFEFLKGLLAGGDLPLTLRGPVASSRFYVLRPTWIRLIDNTQGFGHKDEWQIRKSANRRMTDHTSRITPTDHGHLHCAQAQVSRITDTCTARTLAAGAWAQAGRKCHRSRITDHASRITDHGDKAARRGVPSLVWRAGQDRRLSLIRQWAPIDGARALVDGCGVGLYVRALQQAGAEVWGLDVEHDHVAQAAANAPGAGLCQAVGEHLPYPDASFDLVLSHEVIEHVDDDRAYAAEMIRVLRPAVAESASYPISGPPGRAIIFCPNRLYPFETHGHYWQGRYHFGNTPLINWLPDPLRNRLAPHVRAYTKAGLRALFDGLPARIIQHSVIYPGYDNIVYRRPELGRWLRRVTYGLERTPLQWFGLSHLLVMERI